jgi:hypothetical protein
VTVLWHDGDEAIPKPENWGDIVKEEPGRTAVDTGAFVYGDKGTIMYGSHGAGGVRILPKSAMDAHAKRAKSPEPAPRGGHYADFVQAIREGRKAGSDFAYGGPLTDIAMIGAIAQLFPGKELKWDAANMRFSSSDEATKLLTPTLREGWSL